MQHIFKFLCLCIFGLILVSCKDTSSIEKLTSPTKTSPLSPQQTLSKTQQNTPIPTSSPSSIKISAETENEEKKKDPSWIGQWELDDSSDYHGSQINITKIENNTMYFSLDAFRISNPVIPNPHTGNINDSTASISGNVAIFEDNGFKMKMELLSERQIRVETEGFGYLGAGVIVDGMYHPLKKDNNQDRKTDYLIVPRESVGKIKIGMTKDNVIRLLGKAQEIVDHNKGQSD